MNKQSLHPERWSGETRKWSLEEEWLNPEKSSDKSIEKKQTS